MHDPLDRFVAAQDPVWPAVAAELAAGAKRSHWMWFVFPQIAGLGRSATAQRFALDRAEGRKRRRDAVALDAVAAAVIIERWLAAPQDAVQI